jgi:hypothetical protein
METVAEEKEEVRWRNIELNVDDILEEDVPDFVKNNKIRYRFREEPYNYHHILVIDGKYVAFVPDKDGKYSMDEFKDLKYNNDYL